MSDISKGAAVYTSSSGLPLRSMTVLAIYETTDGRIRAGFRDEIFPSRLTIADALQCVVDHLQEQGC